jgi:RND family efflux transporter MFP subunit
MTWRNLRKVVRYLHAVAGPDSSVGPTDGQLLERFVSQRDEAAFELLLWRHGTMVLNVCRRVLDHQHDAEDAFQATFLAFVRKARSIVRREAVAGWLYRVAFRVAVEARNKAHKTRRLEITAPDELALEPAQEAVWHELRPVLDEELNRLPERLRLPLVLCYLEGKTNEEAARQLGCPPGTIFSRLARGREMLRRRLTRRGLVLSAAGLTILLTQNTASATASALLISPTLKAALLFASAQSAAGTASARVIELAEGVLRAMYMTKLKLVTALFLVIGVLLAGGIMTRHALEAAPQEEANQDKLTKTDDPAKPTQKGRKGPVVVQVMTPLPGGLDRRVWTAITARPQVKVDLFAPVSGVLKNLTVDIGDRVKRGDRLADIDARLVFLEHEQAGLAVKQARNLVRDAESRFATAQAEIDVAKAVVVEKETALSSAKVSAASYKRQHELLRTRFDAGKVDEPEVEEKSRQSETARTQVSAAEAALLNAKADIKVKESKAIQAKVALEAAQDAVRAAELSLQKAKYAEEQTRIIAPFDGVVTQRNFMPWNVVRTFDQGGQQPILTVMRIDSMRVLAAVSEQDSPFTKPGDPVDLAFESLPDERFTDCKVSRTGFVLDDKTGTMRVEIDVPNPKGLLRPGMNGHAYINIGKGGPNIVRIPASALVRIGDGPNEGGWTRRMYVVRDGKAHLTRIELWGGNESEVAVRSGLKPTDRVVIDPRELKGDVIPVEVKQKPDGK